MIDALVLWVVFAGLLWISVWSFSHDWRQAKIRRELRRQRRAAQRDRDEVDWLSLEVDEDDLR